MGIYTQDSSFILNILLHEFSDREYITLVMNKFSSRPIVIETCVYITRIRKEKRDGNKEMVGPESSRLKINIQRTGRKVRGRVGMWKRTREMQTKGNSFISRCRESFESLGELRRLRRVLAGNREKRDATCSGATAPRNTRPDFYHSLRAA